VPLRRLRGAADHADESDGRAVRLAGCRGSGVPVPLGQTRVLPVPVLVAGTQQSKADRTRRSGARSHDESGGGAGRKLLIVSKPTWPGGAFKSQTQHSRTVGAWDLESTDGGNHGHPSALAASRT